MRMSDAVAFYIDAIVLMCAEQVDMLDEVSGFALEWVE